MANVMLSLMVLKTLQLEAMTKFYGAIGIDLIQEKHGNGPVHYAGHVGNVVMEIYPQNESDTTADSSLRLGFVVDDLEEVTQRLQSLDARIVREPQSTQWGIRAVVRDPDGRTIELYRK